MKYVKSIVTLIGVVGLSVSLASATTVAPKKECGARTDPVKFSENVANNTLTAIRNSTSKTTNPHHDCHNFDDED